MNRFLAWPRALRLALLVALCLGAPSLGAALYCDDALFVGRLEHVFPAPRAGSLWLYSIAQAATDETPFWWTSPDLRIAFFRPLSSALFALDHAIAGHSPLTYHVHTLVWFVASVVAVSLLFRRLLTERVGALAALMFAVTPTHALVALWPSARHVSIAATLGFIALLLHVRAREQGSRSRAAVVMLGVALLASETALGAVAYVASFELLGRHDDRRTRALSFAPYAAMTVVYLVLYKALGFGVRGSSVYADPMTNPLTYLRNVPAHVGPLATSQFFGLPSEASAAFPALVPMTIAIGALAMLVFALLLRRAMRLASAEDRRAVRWLLPGALAAGLPGFGGIVGDRALYMPGLGLFAVLALALLHAARKDDAGRRPVLSLIGVGWLFLFQIATAPLAFIAQDGSFVGGSRAAAAAVNDGELPKDAAAAGKESRIFGVGIADPLIGMYLGPTMLVNGGPGARTSMLTVTLHEEIVTRTSDRELSIEIVDGSLLETAFEGVVRPSDAPMRVGDVVMVGATRIAVVAEKNGSPTKLLVTFDRSLSDASLWIVIWKDGAIRRLPPIDIGASLTLTHEKGPVGF